MSATDGSRNGGATSIGFARLGGRGPALAMRQATDTDPAPRAKMSPRRPSAAARARLSEAASGGLVRLGQVALPADAHAPGAARIVITHCLAGLVARRILDEAKLLGTELVTNSLKHADLRLANPVFVRVDLGAEALRIEVENPGTVGIVTVRPADRRSAGGFGLQLVELLAARWGVRRARSTTVWFELGRA
jgi:anti-sigma regulatory factor (Ser/Thr protein kinase)